MRARNVSFVLWLGVLAGCAGAKSSGPATNAQGPAPRSTTISLATDEGKWGDVTVSALGVRNMGNGDAVAEFLLDVNNQTPTPLLLRPDRCALEISNSDESSMVLMATPTVSGTLSVPPLEQRQFQLRFEASAIPAERVRQTQLVWAVSSGSSTFTAATPFVRRETASGAQYDPVAVGVGLGSSSEEGSSHFGVSVGIGHNF
jgi:hypothetical protein